MRRFWLLCAMLVLTAAPALGEDAGQAKQVPRSRAEMTLSFAPLVKRTAPAVVNIYTRTVVRQQAVNPFFDDPFFRRFFGVPSNGGGRSRIQQSLGSGVIVDADGLVVTNNHVIDGADEITVALADRREFPAKVVRRDSRVDLALLRIQAKGERFPTLHLGDSDALQVGDLVLAIGNPFGVGQTVTSGIVSAVARTTGNSDDAGYYVQTDAAINPGNSGGALIDMAGDLVGINSVIVSRSGGWQGIGFAVPSNLVRVMLASAAAGHGIVQPWLGGAGQGVDAQIAAGLGLDSPRGVIIRKVQKGGPLDRAGVREGDVVVGIDGKPVNDLATLHYRLSTERMPGTATLKVWRGGKEREARLPLELPPETPPRDTTEVKGDGPFDGVRIANLSPALVAEIDHQGREEGVVILRVRSGSVASRLGFQRDDVVVSVNGRKIQRVGDLVSANHRSSRGWDIVIDRAGQLLKLRLG